MNKLIAFLVRNSLITNIISVALLVAGLFAVIEARREVFTPVNLGFVNIVTIYPGAAAQEVESLLTIPIEKQLKGIEYVKSITSKSLENRSTITMQLEEGIPDQSKTLQEIKDAVDIAKVGFPDDAEEPTVIEIKTDLQGIIEVAFYKDDPKISELAFRKHISNIVDEIELLPDIGRVDVRGKPSREIHIEINPAKLARYNISHDDIISSLANRNLNLSGGTVSHSGRDYNVRIDKEFNHLDEIRNLAIRTNDYGASVKLIDIANVKDTFEALSMLENANGRPAIIAAILKRNKGDVLHLVRDVKNILEKNPEAGISYTTYNDLSMYTRRRLNVLASNVIIGLFLVFGVLFFFLGWRISIAVSMGMPFAFAITLILMQYFGISINLLSMFGFVMAIGLVVDDAIIISENIYRYIQEGMPITQAAIHGTQEMVKPVVASISTTCFAFSPLIFMSGLMGKFIWIMGAVVVIALVGSLIESFFVLPAHVLDLAESKETTDARKNEPASWKNWAHRAQVKLMAVLLKVYRPLLERAITYKYTTLFITFATFLFSIYLIGKIGFILFPKEGIRIISFSVETEKGIVLGETRSRLKSMEKTIGSLPKSELDSYTTRVGIQQTDINDPFTKRGSNYAQISIFLAPEAARGRTAGQIHAYLQGKLDIKKPVHHVAVMEGAQDTLYHIRNDNYLHLLNTRTDQIKQYKLNIEALLGGIVVNKGKQLNAITMDNIYVSLDIKSNKVLAQKTIDLGVFDLVNGFYPISNAPFDIFTSQLGYVYQIDPTTMDKDSVHQYKKTINFIKCIEKYHICAISYGDSNLDIWEYKEDEMNLRKRIDSIPLYQLAEKRFIPDIQVPMGKINAITLDEANQQIIMGSEQGHIHMLDLKTFRQVQHAHIYNRPISWLKTDPIHKHHIWVNTHDTLALINLKTLKEVITFPTSNGIYRSVYVPSKRKIYFYAKHGFIYKATQQGNSSPLYKIAIVKQEPKKFIRLASSLVAPGPPVGAPIQLEIQGSNFESTLTFVQKVKQVLYSVPGVYSIKDSWESDKKEFNVDIDEKKSAFAGVTVAQIANSVRTAFSGTVASTIKNIDEDIDIRVIFPKQLRNTLGSLKKVKIRNRYGNMVAIDKFVKFREQGSLSEIQHKNFERVVYVNAQINESQTTAVQVNKTILDKLQPTLKKFPGVRVVAGGEYEDTQESMDSLKRAAVIALLGIAIILILLYNNLRYLRVILIAVPLSLTGVTFAFGMHKLFFLPNLVFSFLAMFGMIALAGVVVNDSIVMVDFIRQRKSEGHKQYDAIVQGCLLRLRPVILTTLTTVFGILPTAYGIGGDDPFLKPMALAIGWGLAFASMVTLFVVPAYYAIWEERGYIFHHIKGSLPFTGSQLVDLEKERREYHRK